MSARTGIEPGEGGHAIGRDPRTMSHGELRALGHEPMSPTQALRAHCLDCCAGSPHEVRNCTAEKCPSWPFRMGKSPWRAPISDERREASRRNLARMHSGSSDALEIGGSDAGEDDGAISVTDDAPDDENLSLLGRVQS